MDEVVTVGGVTFRVERVNERYVRYVPLDDPHWLIRHIEPKQEDEG